MSRVKWFTTGGTASQDRTDMGPSMPAAQRGCSAYDKAAGTIVWTHASASAPDARECSSADRPAKREVGLFKCNARRRHNRCHLLERNIRHFRSQRSSRQKYTVPRDGGSAEMRWHGDALAYRREPIGLPTGCPLQRPDCLAGATRTQKCHRKLCL